MAGSRRERLGELTALFLRLGCTAFGGPAVHVAMMEEEVVVRRQWLTREAFLDLLGATNLIPGPNSTEMAIHIGYRRAGWPGLIVAGLSFIVPSALLVSLLAWAYVRYGTLPRSVAALDGIKPVVLAIVVLALWRLGRSLLDNWFFGFLAASAIAATFLGVHELLILAAGGTLVAIARGRALPLASLALPLGLHPTVAAAPSLFWIFVKIGSVLFGSGYVLLAFLRSDLVERLHWLTDAQLLDAVAVGQITPGPVFTTATFVGWILRGPMGGFLATAGIFLPAFVFVALSGPLVPRLRKSRVASAFLDGVNVASLALMASVSWTLGRSAITSVPTAGIALLSLGILLRTKLSSVWLILAGGLLGVLLGFF
jgi:chromate transporter